MEDETPLPKQFQASPMTPKVSTEKVNGQTIELALVSATQNRFTITWIKPSGERVILGEVYPAYRTEYLYWMCSQSRRPFTARHQAIGELLALHLYGGDEDE